MMMGEGSSRAAAILSALAVVVVVIAVSSSPTFAQNLSSHDDLAGLYSLRGSLGLRARDWPRHADPCSAWVGVGCRGGRVVSLSVAGLRRTRLGKLKPQFAVDGLQNLSMLESFNAAGFALPGAIPAWFGTRLPPSFAVLNLTGAGVSGEVPRSLAALTGLTVLALGQNNLSGDLPAGLWSLQGLAVLDVAGNSLTGALPQLIPAFASGKSAQINLAGNLFYGNITLEFISLFGRVGEVNISGNYFDGELGALARNENVSFVLNCFRNSTDQRSPVDCEQFYTARNLLYDGPLPPMLPQPTSAKKANNKLIYILVGTIGGALVLVALAVAITVCCICRRRARKVDERESDTQAARSTGQQAVAAGGAISVQPSTGGMNLARVGDSFAYDRLANATNSFSDDALIRHGHSGDFYQGVLDNGVTIVIKRVAPQLVKTNVYMAELELFGRGLHSRLVPFLGHCLDKEDEKLLIYRYVPNGDLSTVLQRKSGMEAEEEGMHSLDWIKRLKIATGIAEALCYLHHECTPPITHRDIQSSSIFLDDKFEVRLGSLSEICPQEGESHQSVITKLFKLSSASEQATPGTVSATASYDVYCFGKVLLELVTGKVGISGRANSISKEWLDRTVSCINIYDKELIRNIIDPSLIIDEDHLEEVWAMAIIAKSCLNPKSSKRPPVKYILKALENPLKVVREDNGSSSGMLRTTSSRGSWNAAFFGSWRQSSDAGPSRDDYMLKHSETMKSQGSNGEHSLSQRRQSKEIFPEPSDPHDIEE